MKKTFESEVLENFAGTTVTKEELESVLGKNRKYWYGPFLKKFPNTRVGRGLYSIPVSMDMLTTATRQKHVSVHKSKPTSNLAPEILSTDVCETSFGVVPSKDPLFVPFGFHTSLKKILSANIFYPVFITGLSGNGKTKSVQQSCAELGRKLYRVNVTIETDEDDLIGGLKLKSVSNITIKSDSDFEKEYRKWKNITKK